jgi:pimeloyl-ACP methyl ester carboxylesterase
MLKVPGASLYYDVRGDGPLLLMIPGGGGDAGYFTAVAERLADRFRVVTYDRRGNSRSLLDWPGDYSVAQQTDDAVRLLDNFGPAPAYVFGSSLGAVVGLDLATNHPDKVAALVAHEAPLVEVLADPAPVLRDFIELKALYLAQGAPAALAKMAERTDPTETFDPGPELAARLTQNFGFFLEWEMVPTVHYRPDLETLRAGGAPVVVGMGQPRTNKILQEVAESLAAALRTAVVDFPDYHHGYFNVPAEFADRLVAVLERR